jgi:hypothetical protein
MTAPAVAAAPSGTPLRPSPVRAILVGVAAVLVLALVAVVVYALTRTPERPVDYLSPTSGSPDGARAVVNVLRDQGVDVAEVDTLADLEALDLDPRQTTVALFDASLVLGEAQHDRVLDAAHRVVVFDPWDTELADLAPGVTLPSTWTTSGTYPAGCPVPAAQTAEAVSAAAYGYDVSDAEGAVTGCFETGEHAYGFVQLSAGGTELSLVGVSSAITNGAVLETGNAAFALNLLGQDPHLVWYTPSLAELSDGGVVDPSSAAPGWVTPLVLLLALLFLAAAIWRGRRLGPLVAERLPVLVRAHETMTGRARLYERAAARGHALDALRVGAVDRLASVCGLPRRATLDEVVDAVAALTGRPRDDVRTLLVEVEPGNDAALVRFSDDLLRLEAETRRAARGR